MADHETLPEVSEPTRYVEMVEEVDPKTGERRVIARHAPDTPPLTIEENATQVQAQLDSEPLCRCSPNVCLLHPSLTTCGMRERTPLPPEAQK